MVKPMIEHFLKKKVYDIVKKTIKKIKRLRKVRNIFKFLLILKRRKYIKKAIKGVCSKVIQKQSLKIISNSQKKILIRAKEEK
jgi:hypothetical protein